MKSKRIFRMMTIVFVLLTFCLLFMGCPKKTPPLEQGKTGVTTKTQPGDRRPGGLQGDDLGAARKEAEREMAQIAALKGEDIPLKEVPEREFGELSPEERAIFKNIYFDFDRSEIKPEFRAVLNGIGQWMKDNTERQLLTEGHCDERGTNEYNLALGERRALSVRRYLVGLGVHPERLHTISYGEEKPADPRHNEVAWSKNRRAEFKLSSPE